MPFKWFCSRERNAQRSDPAPVSSPSLRHQDLPLHGLRDGEAGQPQRPGSTRPGLHGLHSGQQQQQQLRRGVSGLAASRRLPSPTQHIPTLLFLTPSSSFSSTEKGLFFPFSSFFFLSKPVFLKGLCVGGSGSPDNQEVESLCTRSSRESSAASLVLWCHRRDDCAISE